MTFVDWPPSDCNKYGRVLACGITTIEVRGNCVDRVAATGGQKKTTERASRKKLVASTNYNLSAIIRYGCHRVYGYKCILSGFWFLKCNLNLLVILFKMPYFLIFEIL